jgi:hypothetical protein
MRGSTVHFYVQSVSEIDGCIIDMCFVDQNKEKTSYKHVIGHLDSLV